MCQTDCRAVPVKPIAISLLNLEWLDEGNAPVFPWRAGSEPATLLTFLYFPSKKGIVDRVSQLRVLLIYIQLYLTRSQIALFERVESARLAKNQAQLCEWSWFRPSPLKSRL